MGLKHRYIGERETIRYADWTLPDGSVVKAFASSSTDSVMESDCKHCGAAYEIVGIMGGIRERINPDTCPICTQLIIGG